MHMPTELLIDSLIVILYMYSTVSGFVWSRKLYLFWSIPICSCCQDAHTYQHTHTQWNTSLINIFIPFEKSEIDTRVRARMQLQLFSFVGSPPPQTPSRHSTLLLARLTYWVPSSRCKCRARAHTHGQGNYWLTQTHHQTWSVGRLVGWLVGQWAEGR